MEYLYLPFPTDSDNIKAKENYAVEIKSIILIFDTTWYNIVNYWYDLP